MLLPSLLKSGDQVYQKVINQLYQKMLLLNLLITPYFPVLLQVADLNIQLVLFCIWSLDVPWYFI